MVSLLRFVFDRREVVEGGVQPPAVAELVVIDGAKALRRALLDVFDHPVFQRCQVHKIRNVKDRLPERLKSVAERRVRSAYRADSALDAYSTPSRAPISREAEQ